MTAPSVLTDTKGRVGLITLSRPARMNALNDALMDELGVALLAFDADPGIAAMARPKSGKSFGRALLRSQ